MTWLKYIVKIIVCFLLLFLIGRAVFLLVNDMALTQLIEVQWHALRLDISTIAYILLIPVLLAPFIQRRWASVLLKSYLITVLLITAMVAMADGFFYYYWGFKSNLLFLEYTTEGGEGFASIEASHILLGVSMFLLTAILFSRFAVASISKEKSYAMKAWLVLLPLIGLAARGSISSTPINISSAYYSDDLGLNNASVNPLWNLVQHSMEVKKIEGADLLSDEEEQNLFSQYRAVNSEPLFQIEYNDSTRIILILLESFSSKVSAYFYDNRWNVTPNLDAMVAEGVCFTNAYASSFRSDRAMTAIFKGIPTLARQNLTHYPNLLAKQQDLLKHFNQKGWSTSFHYGGDPSFANLSFVFEKADSMHLYKDVPSEHKGVWGAHDAYVFSRFAESMQVSTTPSFHVLYSLSSHEPYDIKDFQKYEDPYLNSIAYTDSCLAQLITELKHDGNWHNTLVMITADHGSTSPEHSAAILPINYRVPLCMIGGLIKDSMRISTVVSQLDIPATLINDTSQHENWPFGHTLYAPSDMAFYTYYNGLVSIKGDSMNYYDLPQKKYLRHDIPRPLEKAYYQKAVRSFFEF